MGSGGEQPEEARRDVRGRYQGFDDNRAVEAPDADPDEERFKIIGLAAGRLLTVINTERRVQRFRIISAWKATKDEAKTYDQS